MSPRPPSPWGIVLLATTWVHAAEVAEPDLRWLQQPESARVFFSASEFRMGSTPEEMVEAVADCVREPLPTRCRAELFQDEGPVHTVRLSAFWLDRHEVSVARYERCADAQRCAPLPYYRGAARFARKELPAVLVRHRDALDFCTFAGGTLPTEAQFERAARGVSGRKFPWGNLYNPGRANHGQQAFDATDASDGYAELAPVDAFADGVTPDRVFNLAGNAEEWVLDRYAPEYGSSPQSDPTGPGADGGEPERVVRGGSYRSGAVWLRGAARSFAPADARSAERGFRCAYPARVARG